MVAIEDGELDPCAPEIVPGSKAGLPSADDGDRQVFLRISHSPTPVNAVLRHDVS